MEGKRKGEGKVERERERMGGKEGVREVSEREA